MRKVDRAIEFAAYAHRDGKRKGKEIPYISHPFAVGLLLSEAGCDEDVVCAGILHDTLEDTETTRDDLLQAFGERVTTLVEGASEPDKSLSWEERKTHTLAFLRTATVGTCMVTCADKLHNARSLRADLEVSGEQVWKKFNASKQHQEWYYRGLVDSLGAVIGGTPLLEQLKVEVEAVFGK